MRTMAGRTIADLVHEYDASDATRLGNRALARLLAAQTGRAVAESTVRRARKEGRAERPRGRPVEPGSELRGVRLPVDLDSKLLKVAAARGLTRDQALADAVRGWLGGHNSE